MNINTNVTSSVTNKDTEMSSELAAVAAKVLRAMGLNSFSDDDSGPSENMNSSIGQVTRLLLLIDVEHPELGIRSAIGNLISQYQSGQKVNPADTLLGLMERAGLRQSTAEV